jgi:replicative DNA helicase|nr:MAG TPA: DnaB-like replicative helicase [Caudoviricetes sp.]
MTIDALEAESAVCGSILLDDACLPEVLEHLTEADFVLEANRAIFRAAVELYRREEPVDPVSIRAEARGAVSDAYMMELMQATNTAANAGIYAEETRRASMRRSLVALGQELERRASTLEETPRELISAAQRELEAIEAQDTARELATSGDTLLAYYRHRERVDAGAGGYVPTGYRSLDRLLGGGLLNSGFYILAARPGMGKTTFGLAVADQVAQQRGPVLFVSLEMDEEQLAAKRLSRAAGISYDALMMGNLGDEERARAAEWSSKVSQIPVYTNRKPRATVDDIANMARKVKGLKLLVVDYFGLIRTEERAKNRYEAMTEVSGQLKALARKLKVPLLCLAQINRENAQRQDKRPQLSDLRDTGALEQDADGVIFLHCNSYYNQERPDPWEPDYMQIILAKNRHASTGTCDAAFYRAVGRIIPAR